MKRSHRRKRTALSRWRHSGRGRSRRDRSDAAQGDGVGRRLLRADRVRDAHKAPGWWASPTRSATLTFFYPHW